VKAYILLVITIGSRERRNITRREMTDNHITLTQTHEENERERERKRWLMKRHFNIVIIYCNVNAGLGLQAQTAAPSGDALASIAAAVNSMT
jgi:hypothetical protein